MEITYGHGRQYGKTTAQMAAMAAEITRLRAEVERKDKALRWYAADYDHAKGCSQWDGGAKARAALGAGS